MCTTPHAQRRTYIPITGDGDTDMYGFRWFWQFQARRDRRQFRLVSGGLRWRGNTGGFRRDRPIYFDRIEGRKYLRRLREGRVLSMKGQILCSPYEYAAYAYNYAVLSVIPFPPRRMETNQSSSRPEPC